jgi:hypothetical protein
MAMQKIIVEGIEVSIKTVDDKDYISLTDIAKKRNNQTTDTVIQAWLKRGNTLRFLELWEQENNPDFKPLQMQGIRLELSQEANFISAKQLIERANIIGIQSRRGRYGGTFAHVDIAFEFATWLSPELKFYLIKEFQRLKAEEAERLNLEYNEIRFLTKVNYTLQTKAIEENIIPRLNKADKSFAYSNEADLINQVVFGMTARQWKEKNPDLKGNMRDYASILELNILNNLQARNSELIDNGVDPELRFRVLLQIAQKQFERLADDQRLQAPGEPPLELPE